MIREAIELLVNQQDLSQEQAAQVMEEIMTDAATPAQLGAFLTALRIKGETAEEMAGMAAVMRDKANRVHYQGELVDTCGTGGDASGSFNVSTAAAFVATAAGLKVAKHGNRAISGQCGSADVLEALGVKLELTPDQVRRCLDQAGIGFMFAPAFHPAMRFAAGPRREIGIRTVFNILGRSPTRRGPHTKCWEWPTPPSPPRWLRCSSASVPPTPWWCMEPTAWTS